MNDNSKFECYKCCGAGEVLRKNDHYGTDMCPKCFGVGKLDWVENARGGKRKTKINIEQKNNHALRS